MPLPQEREKQQLRCAMATSRVGITGPAGSTTPLDLGDDAIADRAYCLSRSSRERYESPRRARVRVRWADPRRRYRRTPESYVGLCHDAERHAFHQVAESPLVDECGTESPVEELREDLRGDAARDEHAAASEDLQRQISGF